MSPIEMTVLSSLVCSLALFPRPLAQLHIELCDQGLGDQGLQGWQAEVCREMWTSPVTRPVVSNVQIEVWK